MADAPSADRLRGLGLLESFHTTRCDCNFDGRVVTSARYTTAAGSTLDYSALQRALKRVILTHPSLCVQIEGETGKGPFHFRRLPTIDLNEVLVYHKPENVGKTLEEVLTHEMRTPFPRGPAIASPLWRITVLENNTVIFAWHHAIADGRSAQAFHRTLWTALNEVAGSEETSTVITVPRELVLPPVIEERIDVTLSWKSWFMMLFSAFAPPFWQKLNSAWTGNPVVLSADSGVQLRLTKIAPEDAKLLLKVCREHDCTLTTFLHTLAVCALSHLVKNNAGGGQPNGDIVKRYKSFSTVIPISLRRFTGVSDLDMCDHVSSHSSFPPIDRTVKYPLTKVDFPWKTATDLGKAINSNLENTPQTIGTIKYMYSLNMATQFFTGRAGKQRGGTLELSNVGVMPSATGNAGGVQLETPPGRGEWEVDEVVFGQNDSIVGAAIKMNVAGSPSGALNISYTWGKGAMHDEFVETFVQQMQVGITTILESP